MEWALLKNSDLSDLCAVTVKNRYGMQCAENESVTEICAFDMSK